MPTKIRCVVERITYQNPESGYCVLKCRVKGYSELVPVVGNLLDASVGSVLIAEGSWKVDAKYGREFVADDWEETLPATAYGMEKYLGSGLIKGVGPKYARRIVQKFGADTFSVIDKSPERLMEVEGIGKKRIGLISESWQRQKEIKNVMLFLQEQNVSASLAARIYARYGDESISVMRENPYRLADDVRGIGFLTADQIAGRLGYGKDSFVRIRSGLMYTLSELSSEGHVYARKWQLIDEAARLLESSPEAVVMTMDEMLKQGELIMERGALPSGEPEEAVYLPPFYYAEIGVAGKLRRLSEAPAEDRLSMRLEEARRAAGNPALSVDVASIQRRTGMEYDGVQADAIRRAADAKVMVITGGPGTGKTTTTRGIIAAYRAYGLRILLAAPTGRAAKRMAEATGMEAKTIHRLLECKPPDGYNRNEDNPLEGDALIIDECSMIDVILMNALLRAVPPSMRLILVGDVDQLPSVGPGNVLRDVIGSGAFPVVRLETIFRQARESGIIINAHRINEGRMPDLSGGAGSDFLFVEEEDQEAAREKIVELVSKELPGRYGVDPMQIQVLTPMQKGAVGATGLNIALQEALNPPERQAYVPGRGMAKVQKGAIRRSGFLFREGDKVMQVRNNYSKDVFNGDIGRISRVRQEDGSLTAEFDGRAVEYASLELDELVHAYATTIHKAQGSEYPVVVMPIMPCHAVMLQRNLLYTGITRAKSLLVIVGTRGAIFRAVQNAVVSGRNSMLRERLMRR